MNLLQNDGGRRSFAPATAINEEASSHHGSFRSKASSKFEADPFEREPDDIKSRFDSDTSSEDLSEQEDLEIQEAFKPSEGLKDKMSFLRRNTALFQNFDTGRNSIAGGER